HVLGALEEFLVLGIRSRPAAFDVVNSQLIQLLRDDQLVVYRERDRLALRAVAQRGVERKDFHFRAASAGCSSGTPTSFVFFKKVIISRSSRPTVSIFWLRAASRIARKFLRPVLFSAIHCRANSPDCTSLRILRISARVCSFTTRGPRV